MDASGIHWGSNPVPFVCHYPALTMVNRGDHVLLCKNVKLKKLKTVYPVNKSFSSWAVESVPHHVDPRGGLLCLSRWYGSGPDFAAKRSQQPHIEPVSGTAFEIQRRGSVVHSSVDPWEGWL